MSGRYKLPELLNSNCVKRGDEIFFSPFNLNAFCKINIKTGETDLLEGFSGETIDQCSLFNSICMDENKKAIVCVPDRAKRIYIYNLETKMEDVLTEDGRSSVGIYYNVCCLDKYWYVFPFLSEKMQKIDVEENRVVASIDIRQQYKKFSGYDYKYFSYSGCYIFDKKIYMAMRDTPMIAEFDTGSEQFHFYKFDGDSPIYLCVVGHMGSLYILGSDGKIYVWDIKKRGIIGGISSCLCEGEDRRYRYSARYKNCIYIFTYNYSDEHIKIDLETWQAEMVTLKGTYGIENQLYFMTAEGEYLYFISREYVMVRINLETNEVSRMQLNISGMKLDDFVSLHMRELGEKRDTVILEGDYVWTLGNYITRQLCASQHGNSDKDRCGDLIYKKCFTDFD